MLNSMKDIHAAIRTMSDDELRQLLQASEILLKDGTITVDQATEIAGVAIAHMLERSITA